MDTTEPQGHVVIVAGGDIGSTIEVPHGASVIAADSGYDHARAAHIAVDVLVGDLDSISPAGRRHAEEHDVAIEIHPSDKDATDLELALDAALGMGAETITMYGGEGGSPGHRLAGLMVLTSERFRGVRLRWHVAGGVIHVVRPDAPLLITDHPGARVTIVPVGDVTGVRTRGLRWQLTDDTLPAGSGRGTNNVLDEDHGSVAIGDGVALVVVEGARP